MCWARRNGSASRIVSPNVCVGAAVFLCLVGIVCILFYHVSPIFLCVWFICCACADRFCFRSFVSCVILNS